MGHQPLTDTLHFASSKKFPCGGGLVLLQKNFTERDFEENELGMGRVMECLVLSVDGRG